MHAKILVLEMNHVQMHKWGESMLAEYAETFFTMLTSPTTISLFPSSFYYI